MLFHLMMIMMMLFLLSFPQKQLYMGSLASFLLHMLLFEKKMYACFFPGMLFRVRV
jgi:hypothetical protein